MNQSPLGNPSKFLNNIFSNLAKSKIDVSSFYLDHICYRVETMQQYFSLKEKMQTQAEFLIESEINGRSIVTYRLYDVFVFENRKINIVEIPAPKEDSFYKAGFEHVEFVLDISFEEFIKKHSSINFDKKGLSKKINPELRIKFGDQSVKFHQQSLEEVIAFEKKLKFTKQ